MVSPSIIANYWSPITEATGRPPAAPAAAAAIPVTPYALHVLYVLYVVFKEGAEIKR